MASRINRPVLTSISRTLDSRIITPGQQTAPTDRHTHTTGAGAPRPAGPLRGGQLVENIEAALDAAGVLSRPERVPAMCFLDLVGYTRFTEEHGDQVAAELAEALAVRVDRSSRERGGVPVKWLGDGVMVHFRDPAGAVLAALQMVEQLPAAGLPPAHVGVAAGPVVVQGGDYFGRTVNLAARTAAHAGGGQVLVSQRVDEAVPPAA